MWHAFVSKALVDGVAEVSRMKPKEIALAVGETALAVAGAGLGGYALSQVGGTPGFFVGVSGGLIGSVVAIETAKNKVNEHLEEKRAMEEKAVALGKYRKKIKENEEKYNVLEHDKLSKEEIEKNFAIYYAKGDNFAYYDADIAYSISKFQEAIKVCNMRSEKPFELLIPAECVKDYGISYTSDRFPNDEKHLDIKINSNQYKFALSNSEKLEDVLEQKIDSNGNSVYALKVEPLQLEKINGKYFSVRHDSVEVDCVKINVAFSRIMDEIKSINVKVNRNKKSNEKGDNVVSLKQNVFKELNKKKSPISINER